MARANRLPRNRERQNSRSGIGNRHLLVLPEDEFDPEFDVGLMNAICGLGWQALSRLDDIQLTNDGSIAEQFIGQHLQALLAEGPNRELTYWLREGRS